MNAISEQNLREALRRVRPDVQSFRQAVLTGIAKAENSKHVKEVSLSPETATSVGKRIESRGPNKSVESSRERTAANSIQQAAAVLPFGLLGPTVFAMTKNASLKGMGAVLALPALSLAMLGFGFVTAIRTLLGIQGQQSDCEQEARAASNQWWKAHGPHCAIAIGVLLLLAATQPTEALLVALLLSMVSVAGLISSMARSGAASRRNVAQFSASFLGMLLGIMLFIPNFAVGLRTERIPDNWIALTLLLGFLVASLWASWSVRWSRTRKLIVISLGAASLVLSPIALVRIVRPPSRVELAAFVNDFDRPLTQPHHWEIFGHVGAHLRNAKWTVNPQAARTRLETAWAEKTKPAFGIDASLNPFSLWAASRVDAIPSTMWPELSQADLCSYLLASDNPIRSVRLQSIFVQALEKTGPLSDVQRSHIEQRLLSGWPTQIAPIAENSSEVEVLRDMARRVELLDYLGRPISEETYRSSVHDALRAHWLGLQQQRPFAAPFVAGASMLVGSAKGMAANRASDHAYVEPTCDAVQLMQRFGIPEDIDLERVVVFLRHAATPSAIEILAPKSIPILDTQPYRYRAGAALDSLLHSGLLDPRSKQNARLSALLLGERVWLGTILLVALCLFAILRAPGAKMQPQPKVVG